MITCSYYPYSFHFKKPATTSRGILTTRTFYLIKIDDGVTTGWGEAGTIPGLSLDDKPEYESIITKTCQRLTENPTLLSLPVEELAYALDIRFYPSILFAIESAVLDWKNGGRFILFNSSFSQSKKAIPINGLVWMDTAENMLKQVEEKINAGFTSVKLKIGALDFDEECRLLETVRKKYNAFHIELRLDANGAFDADSVAEQLTDLARFDIHSIEQPVKAGQWELMNEVCHKSKIPIALDEELIGLAEAKLDDMVLKKISPSFLILKPGLLGGFTHCQNWIKRANKLSIGYWITSALESNIGLNAIAQFTATLPIEIPQGLGTGQLYVSNFESPLEIEGGALHYRYGKKWMV
jgi:o-succinylbenzoate synthase